MKRLAHHCMTEVVKLSGPRTSKLSYVAVMHRKNVGYASASST